MSHWDFSRRPDAERGARPPEAGTAYEPDLLHGADADDARDPRQAYGERPERDAWPGAAEAGQPWHEGGRRPADGGLVAPAGGFPAGEWRPDEWPDEWPGQSPWEDAWDDGTGDDGEGTAPYPITYERDDDLLAGTRQPAPPPAAPWEPWQPASRPDAEVTEVTDAPGGPWGDPAAPDAPAGGPGWTAAGPAAPADALAGWGDGGRARRAGRRWLILAGVIAAGAAAGAAAVLGGGQAPGGAAPPAGHPAGGAAAPPVTPAAHASPRGSSPAAAAPLTLGQAQAVLARYTRVNNSANAQRSDALLATAEAGSSYAIDAGLYQAQQGTAPYPAFAPARATYYIPRGEPASGPRWFVAQVANAFSSDPQKVTSSEYLLFTQAAAGSPWLDTAEPYLLPAAATPQVTVGTDGLATAVSPDAALALPPARLPAATATALNGTSHPALTAPGNLADTSDQHFWQARLTGGQVTDTHAPGTNGTQYALRTAGGGALVLYTGTAQLTITPPPGTTLHLSVPGFYAPARPLTRATLTYQEQFAAYDPPAATHGTPAIIADYSGITGKN
jgi:hypothetical protein